jgi:hypothetical protein
VFGEDNDEQQHRFGQSRRRSQKPNCRSLVQGLERQGLRRHLPSRSSVRAELRDGDSSVAAEMWFCILSRVMKRQGSPLYLCGWKRKDESKSLTTGCLGDEHVKSSTPS